MSGSVVRLEDVLHGMAIPEEKEEIERFEKVLALLPVDVKPTSLDLVLSLPQHGALSSLPTQVLELFLSKLNLEAIKSLSLGRFSLSCFANEVNVLQEGILHDIVKKCERVEILFCHYSALNDDKVIDSIQKATIYTLQSGATTILFKSDRNVAPQPVQVGSGNIHERLQTLYRMLKEVVEASPKQGVQVVFDGYDVVSGKDQGPGGTNELNEDEKEEDNHTFDSIENMHHLGSIRELTGRMYWDLDSNSGVPTGRGMTIAVVDSGIDPYHPAIYPKLEKGELEFKDFTGQLMKLKTSYHGTTCAGIVCGMEYKFTVHGPPFHDYTVLQFPSGVAPDAKLIVCKVSSKSNGKGNSAAIVQALKWLRERGGVDVVSYSIGTDTNQPEIKRAINDLMNSGTIVVCASSNYGRKQRVSICYPAKLPLTLCIGSHDEFGNRSKFSPVGYEMDFLGPGENIFGPVSSHELSPCNGTSYATPAVAGLICLMLQAMKENLPQDTYKAMKDQQEVREMLKTLSTETEHSKEQGFGAFDCKLLNKFFEKFI